MLIKTVPLSWKDSDKLDDLLEIYLKVIPIGVGYKKYLDEEFHSNNYALVINTHDEVNIHFINSKSLQLSKSIIIPEYSIEYLIYDAKSSDMISKILDIQLDSIMDKIYQIDPDICNIIYLENSTDYINYFNKTDKIIITDPFWKIHEYNELKKLVGLDSNEDELTFITDEKL